MSGQSVRAADAIAIAAVLAAMILVVLDAAIANVALPTIAAAFDVSPAQSIWVVTAYQTALVMALLPCAALGESLGHHRVFKFGVALFTVASVACALSPTLGWLVAARFAQGIGGAAVMALGVALLRLCVPSDRLGIAIGWNAMAVALASAAGPTIGAAILACASWPWLFAVKLPLGLVVLVAARSLPRAKGAARGLDLVSMGLNAGGFGALVLGATLMPGRPTIASILLGSATLALVVLIRRERSSAVPVIPLDLLRSISIRRSVIASVCCFAGQSAGLVALPFHLQHSLGFDALTTGVAMTPWPLTVALAAPFVGRLAARASAAPLCAAGGTCLALSLGAVAVWPAEASPVALVPFTMLGGLGFALFNVPNNRNLLISARPERSGAAGGLQATARLFGQILGATGMTILFGLVPPDVAPRIGFFLGALSALAAGLISALPQGEECRGNAHRGGGIRLPDDRPSSALDGRPQLPRLRPAS